MGYLFELFLLCNVIQVPWKSLGKEPVIVLIDRVFVLAHPAPDSRTIKVQQYSVSGLINIFVYLL